MTQALDHRFKKDGKDKKMPAISILGPVLDSQLPNNIGNSIKKRDGSLNTSYNLTIFSKKFNNLDEFI